MRRIALMSVFNEADSIKRAIESVVDYVDEVHVYDGAILGFPFQNFRSTDGTIEIAKNLPKVRFFEAKEVYKDQLEKRTKMFEGGKEGDYFFILDADEWVQSFPDLTDEDFDVGWFLTKSNLYEKPYATPRIIKYRKGLHYAGRHSWLYDEQNLLVASHQHYTRRLEHQFFTNAVYNLRKEDREALKKKFRRYRNATEARNKTENMHSSETLLQVPERATKPRNGFQSILRGNTRPKYSLIVPFSRPWAVQKWFRHFAKVKLPPKTEILAIADTNNNFFYNRISWHFRKLNNPNVVSIRLYRTDKLKLKEFTRVKLRRERIISNFYQFQTEARGDYILGAEDDTLPDVDAYIRLIDILGKENAGFVQATELGRWNNPVIPHWKIDEDSISSGEYSGQNVVEIDGGGWYCFAMPTDVFRKVDLRWTIDPPMGPDLCFVNDIKSLGHKCLGVWDINCEHFTERLSLHPLRTQATKIEWQRVKHIRHKKYAKWQQKRFKSCRTLYNKKQ